MGPVASVHVADVGFRAGLGMVMRRPKPARVPGLRHAEIGTAAPLSAAVRPRPTFSRVVLVAFWDDDESVDRFMAEHDLARRFSDGWSARLQPVRLSGSWPGLEDLGDIGDPDLEGPMVVLTLGRLRLTRARRFLQASARTQAAVLGAPGLIWGTGFARLPFVATCSLWSSAQALTTYAYGDGDGGDAGAQPDDSDGDGGGAHAQAIREDRDQPFHHRSAFLRCRPYRVQGDLSGRNALDAMAVVAPRSDAPGVTDGG